MQIGQKVFQTKETIEGKYKDYACCIWRNNCLYLKSRKGETMMLMREDNYWSDVIELVRADDLYCI